MVPVNPVPEIVTLVPTGPVVGVNPEIVGDGMTVKFPLLVAVPPGASTWTGPVVAPAGTLSVIWVSETTVNDGWLVPLKRTAEAPEKPAPLMVTEVPTGPLVGVNPVIAGAGITVKLPLLVAVPPGVSIWMGPEVASEGTAAVIWESDTTLNDG